jgi:hypothetical protein
VGFWIPNANSLSRVRHLSGVAQSLTTMLNFFESYESHARRAQRKRRALAHFVEKVVAFSPEPSKRYPARRIV